MSLLGGKRNGDGLPNPRPGTFECRVTINKDGKTATARLVNAKGETMREFQTTVLQAMMVQDAKEALPIAALGLLSLPPDKFQENVKQIEQLMPTLHDAMDGLTGGTQLMIALGMVIGYKVGVDEHQAPGHICSHKKGELDLANIPETDYSKDG